MTPRAYIVHRIRNRMRLRIREKRNECRYFEAVRRELDLVPGIDEIRINTLTGTILLLHPDETDDRLVDRLRRLGLFEIIEGDEPAASVLTPITSGLSLIDQTLHENTGGRIDLRALAYIALMSVTVTQLVRGQVLGPALPVAWQALSLLDRVNSWKQAAVEDSGARDAADTAPGDSD
ncbi:MAG: hypothetical protein PVI50_00485 [Gammaproteobacteria bacterium]|jgi:hypothetical protein